MVPMGPERWGPASEEWVIHLNYPVDDPRAQSDAQVEADARQALGVPDLPMKIHKITRWSVEAVMASAFRAGRVFLLGDAAHRHPPTGGLGLTSAIHDAQNLCWKVALVLAGHASPALLDTYQAERRPVDERNAQRSLENAVNHFAIGAALGVSHENTPEQNMAQLRRMWSGRPEDAGHRSAVLRAMRAQSMEFSELNVEYGYCYQSAAVVPDGSAAPATADEIRVYQPSTRPGAPLPHAWVEDEDGHRRPVGPARAGSADRRWAASLGEAPAQLAAGRHPRCRARRRHDPCALARRRRSPRRRDPAAWTVAMAVLATAFPRHDAAESGGQSGTASASFSATSFRSACRCASSFCKALAMAASCSLATFTLASASSAWACSASAWACAAFAWVLASAWALAAFAGDSRLGCLLTTVSWLRSLNERTCLALDHEAAAQRAAVSRALLTLVTRAARGAARRPLQIEVHRLRSADQES